ncbi:Putative Ca2+/H+ antiporter, TMEM165/GDT1 family [Natronoarchaeum philippinense]|uniref:Putative Ca2+/H+ antiporter, TMEM165/GDT1 family n=1 Tax=Natronoarchaeum philippinense TaxID=558529 RepID=A0A285NZJ1_NATPI|nr:TMEM165/GDT1 family protein [Natronoarchaeum philippinense]SNZ14912.1 Putative Ca2+/H+ antiporter, TMEM165/GDT1 family [Natronoarchaeum philippinense]
MSDAAWLQVLAVAFVAQLAVLPGEKVQFIIAGLSTRYHPLLVVAAAGSAFAGWTALEVWLGGAITGAVPGIYIDALTAVMFAAFAVMLVRTAPEEDADDAAATSTLTDGGELDVRVPVLGWTVPNVLGGFLPIFAMMAFGEFGDKTQLVTITLATQYPSAPTAIWAGEMLAIIPISLLNAYVFHRFSHRFDLRKAHFVGAALFAFFAADFVMKVAFDVSVWESTIGTIAAAIPA